MKAALSCTLALAIFWGAPAVGTGEPAPDAAAPPPSFTLPGLDGRQHELGEWRDKVILLNFWASWCSPCQSEIRDLVTFQTRYGPEGLQIVGIGMDDEARLRNVQRTLGINYPVLLSKSSGGTLMSRYGNREGVVPYSVLISRKGEVVYRHAGTIDQEMFAERVLPLLK